MKTGLDCFIENASLRRPLANKRIALLAHPASVTQDLTHSLDALAALDDITLSVAFGPQHGLRGDKQDNMMESPDYTDPRHQLPVFSLYGESRHPTDAMMDSFDVDMHQLPLNLSKNSKSLKKSIYLYLVQHSMNSSEIEEVLYHYLLKNIDGNDAYREYLSLYEKPLIHAGLKKYGSQLQLSQVLGINRNTLRKKIYEHHID